MLMIRRLGLVIYTTVRLRSLVNFYIKARLNWTRHLRHTVYIALNKKKRISPPKLTYYVE